jgi:hypothetical protein
VGEAAISDFAHDGCIANSKVDVNQFLLSLLAFMLQSMHNLSSSAISFVFINLGETHNPSTRDQVSDIRPACEWCHSTNISQLNLG